MSALRDAVEELAQAASPGPWRLEAQDDGGIAVLRIKGQQHKHQSVCDLMPLGDAVAEVEANAEFIAAFGSPDRAKAIVEAHEHPTYGDLFQLTTEIHELLGRGEVPRIGQMGALLDMGRKSRALLRDLATALGVATGGSDGS